MSSAFQNLRYLLKFDEDIQSSKQVRSQASHNLLSHGNPQEKNHLTHYQTKTTCDQFIADDSGKHYWKGRNCSF